MPSSPSSLRLFLAASCLALAGCGKSNHASDHGSEGATGHAHRAPHGGKLIELGDHFANLELVHTPGTGTLTAYVLDAHAEDFVRIAAASIEVTVRAGGEALPVSLKAVANAATGETVGNTSQFEGQAEWLKKPGELNGEIGPVEVRGTRFPPLVFQLR